MWKVCQQIKNYDENINYKNLLNAVTNERKKANCFDSKCSSIACKETSETTTKSANCLLFFMKIAQFRGFNKLGAVGPQNETLPKT